MENAPPADALREWRPPLDLSHLLPSEIGCQMIRHTAIRAAVLLVLLEANALALADEPQPSFSEADLEFFEKEVRPILASRCYECHGPDAQEGSLRLDSRLTILAGGDTGPAIEPGRPEESLLIDAINYGDIYEMPPSDQLPDEEIAVLTKWVSLGAPWPAEDAASISTDYKQGIDVEQRKASHWCWQPVTNPAPPAVKDADWPQSPVDRFILAKLEAQGLTPARPAARATLLRRLHYDLIGLPPTPQQVEAFVQDESSQAVEKVVEELLASPHFGERWGRHWLDLMRYAESRGHEKDFDAPNAYQYRNYVIRALNADVPYDELIVEHIAGDLLPQPRLSAQGHNESILGTGFWFLGDWVHSPTATRKDEADRFENMIDVMTKSFLGLTVGCARCHDHKFDAITTEDYYALAGYLQSSSFRQVRFETMEHNRQVGEELVRLRSEYEPQLRAAIATAAQGTAGRFGDYLLATEQIVQLRRAQPAEPTADEYRALARQVAAQQKLDGPVLENLIVHLLAARKIDGDPLRLWAEALFAEPASPGARTQAAEKVAAEWQARSKRFEQGLEGTLPVFDFHGQPAEPWITDGEAFGRGPRELGTLRLDVQTARPLGGVFSYAAAVADPAFAVLNLAPGVSHGKDNRSCAWDAAGRMWRSPTFNIEKRYICCLVRGAGYLNAVVDSHRMNHGPLHGELIHHIKGQDGQWQWVCVDANRYVGTGVHLEFTPGASGALEVVKIVQSDRTLAAAEPGAALLGEHLAGEDFTTLAELAPRYQSLLTGSLEMLKQQRAGTDDDAQLAQVADWIVRQLDLFAPVGTAGRTRITRLLDEYQQRRQAETHRLRRTSHLAMAMLDGNGVDEDLFIRGNYLNLADPVPRRFLEALGGRNQPTIEQGSGRLQLAQQIIDPSNPLTARVAVNRVWHHLFGRGIVPTVDNFGVLGQTPSHPELLDYLATQFVDQDWSLKRLIRTLVLTRTYQMSSLPSPEALETDPTNMLLQHARIRRLQGEAIRDAILSISGRLDPQQGGPSVPVHLTDFMQGRGRPESGPLDGAGRRSIYISVRRNFLSPMMMAFDAPTPSTTIGSRNISNVPAQALILLNDPFVVQQSRIWAARLQKQVPDTRERIEQIYLASFARRPTGEEVAAAEAFLTQQAAARKLPVSAVPVWADLCHVMWNVKEFIFIN